MDAFFASIEQRDNPSLAGKPVVVGGNPNSRSVASTCSYEARKYGIRSAMSLAEAKRRCPEAIFLPVDMPKYAKVSAQMHAIFQDYTPLIEPISLDEAFLDVTDSILLFKSANYIALEIKRRIRENLKLTASVGIGPNKFLAKIASDIKKPDGFMMIDDDPLKIQTFLDPLPVERIWGVGPKTAEKLSALNIKCIADLRKMDQLRLESYFGSAGVQLYYLSRGIDNRPVECNREAKSIGREITFAEDLKDLEIIETFMMELAQDVGRRLRKESLKAKTISIKVRFQDFSTLTRSRTLDHFTNLDKDIFTEASLLLRKLECTDAVRLIGVTVHNFVPEDFQYSLFEEKTTIVDDKLVKTMDSIKERFGEKSITRARLLKLKD